MIQEMSPQVIQVWFEPLTMDLLRDTAAASTLAMSLKGEARFTAQTISWLPDPKGLDVLPVVLAPGGRLSIRVHCGTLFDERNQIFSAALDAALGFETPHLPGGVFESWFFINRR